jgi:hypothetical protein
MFYRKVVGTVLDLLIPGELYSCRRSLLFAYIQARFPSTSPLSQKWLVQFSKKFSVQGDMVCGGTARFEEDSMARKRQAKAYRT